MAVISICYKHGVRMDEQYYLTKHAPLVERVWDAQGLERAEIRKLTAASDGSAPPSQIIFSVYFRPWRPSRQLCSTQRAQRC
jgi:hypothetical protein